MFTPRCRDDSGLVGVSINTRLGTNACAQVELQLHHPSRDYMYDGDLDNAAVTR